MKAATALSAASGLFALMVHSLFDFNLQVTSNALLFLVLTSVVSRIAADAKKGDHVVTEQAATSFRMRAAV